MINLKIIVSSLLGLSAISTQAAIIAFDIQGKGGFGLLSTNEVNAPTGLAGSGGEVGQGITYNDVTNVLTLNFAWGSANRFTDLTGNATAGHIHGATPSGGAASFNQSVGVAFGLDSGPTWNASATAGGVTNRTVTFTEAQEVDLLAGKFYLNIHTATNGGGEIRGSLVIPETSSVVLGAVGMLGLLVRKRR